MTDKQFEKIKKGLQFYSEGGIDNLCTMTETTLRTIIEDATKSLEAQIEKMKCCGNCKNGELSAHEEPCPHCQRCFVSADVTDQENVNDKWELAND